MRQTSEIVEIAVNTFKTANMLLKLVLVRNKNKTPVLFETNLLFSEQ